MIVRVPSNERETFTVISNELIADPLVSPQAIGVYCYLLSKPSDWTIRAEDVAAVFRLNGDKKIGYKSVLSALKELENHGYIERVVLENGSIVTSTILYESKNPKYQKTKSYLRKTCESVIKMPRNDRNTFTAISNETLNEPSLSLRALGLHCYILAQKDTWEFTYKSIANALTLRGNKNMGVQTVKTAVKELEEEGYSERVRTGKGLMSMNSDIVIYESSASKYKLSLWEKKKLGRGDGINLENRSNYTGEIIGKLDPQRALELPSIELLTDDVVNGDTIIKTIKNKNCNVTKTVNSINYVVSGEKRFPVSGISLGLGLKNTGPRTTKEEDYSQGESTRSTKESSGTNTEDFSHVKGKNMSRQKKKVKRLVQAVKHLDFPNIISSDYRVRKILSELNTEYKDKWLLQEDNYDAIQSVLDETAQEINNKQSVISWDKGAHVLIKNRLIDIIDTNEVDIAIESARSDEEKEVADYYQRKLDRWDKMCRESGHVDSMESLRLDADDEAIAIMIFSQSPEDKDKLHPERSRFLKKHGFYSNAIDKGDTFYAKLEDSIKVGGLNVLAKRKGIDDLPSFLSSLTKKDLSDTIPDYENF